MAALCQLCGKLKMMDFIYIVCFLQNCFLGGLFARVDGGGYVSINEQIERALCMSFFIIACVPFAGWWAALAALGVVGLMTGHGQYFVSALLVPQKPEFVDPVVRLFFGEDFRAKFPATYQFHVGDYADYEKHYRRQTQRRCVFGMFVTGTLVGLPAAILALAFGQWVAAALFSLTGLCKAVAYVIGFKFFDNNEVSEWINGGLRTAAALAALCVNL